MTAIHTFAHLPGSGRNARPKETGEPAHNHHGHVSHHKT